MDKFYTPKARQHDLLITKVEDETVVYDFTTDTGSCLNDLTTIIWEACDGHTDTASLLDAIKCSGYPDANINLIWKALDQLEQAKLIERSVGSDNNKSSPNRRDMFRALSAGAIGALPLISTVIIQPALAQMSGLCLPKNAPCFFDSQCCSNNCRSNGTCHP